MSTHTVVKQRAAIIYFMFMSPIDNFPHFGVVGTTSIRAGALKWTRTKNSMPYPIKSKMKAVGSLVITLPRKKAQHNKPI